MLLIYYLIIGEKNKSELHHWNIRLQGNFIYCDH